MAVKAVGFLALIGSYSCSGHYSFCTTAVKAVTAINALTVVVVATAIHKFPGAMDPK